MTTTASLPPASSQTPPLTAQAAVIALLFLGWLEAGYTGVLIALGHAPWRAALWQAALCIAAIPPMLFLVVKLVSSPKGLRRLPRAVTETLWTLGDISEVVLPWVGWSALCWLLTGGAWSAALLPGGGIAAFSYGTGLLLLLLLRPHPGRVRITRLELPIPGLPAAFDGYAILHLTDLHCSHLVPAGEVAARLAVGAELACDIVAFTGDAANNRRDVLSAAGALAALRPRDRSFAVLGNHDIWAGGRLVRRILTEHGLHVLVDEHVAIARGGQRIYLVGADNTAYNDEDTLPVAFTGVPDGAVTILLSHAPEVILRPLASRAALILAGHTHGGQLVLPLLGPFHVPSSLGRRYASGLFGRPGHWLYVNRGLGEIFPPLRLLCPPEIALITLRAASNSPSPGRS